MGFEPWFLCRSTFEWTDLYANNAYQHVLANLIHPTIPDETDESSSEYSQEWPLQKKQEYLDSVDPNTPPTGVVPQEGDPGFEDLKGVPRSRWCLPLKKAQYGLKRSPH